MIYEEPMPKWDEQVETARTAVEQAFSTADEMADRIEAARAKLDEAVAELRTLRDYLDDASRGILRCRGKSDISEMAGEDLVRLDNLLSKLENRHD